LANVRHTNLADLNGLTDHCATKTEVDLVAVGERQVAPLNFDLRELTHLEVTGTIVPIVGVRRRPSSCNRNIHTAEVQAVLLKTTGAAQDAAHRTAVRTDTQAAILAVGLGDAAGAAIADAPVIADPALITATIIAALFIHARWSADSSIARADTISSRVTTGAHPEG
jgi:hypothetical protein